MYIIYKNIYTLYLNCDIVGFNDVNFRLNALVYKGRIITYYTFDDMDDGSEPFHKFCGKV